MSFSPVQPPDEIAKSLAEKRKIIDSVAAPVKAPPVSNVRRSIEPFTVDKVNPKATYGSRSGEKRINVSDMTKPLGSFEKGTDFVPKTGNYKLHKGEAVVPAKDNDMNPYKLITEGEKKPAKRLHEIRTRKSKNGGYIHEHHYTEPAHHKMEEHTSADTKSMIEHMSKHGDTMGKDMDEEKSETPGTEQQEQALGMEPQE